MEPRQAVQATTDRPLDIDDGSGTRNPSSDSGEQGKLVTGGIMPLPPSLSQASSSASMATNTRPAREDPIGGD